MGGNYSTVKLPNSLVDSVDFLLEDFIRGPVGIFCVDTKYDDNVLIVDE